MTNDQAVQSRVRATSCPSIPNMIQSSRRRGIIAVPSGCTAALSKARTHIEHRSPGDDLPYLYWVTPAVITAYAGQCLLQLGDTGPAITLLDEGIALFDESFTRDRQADVTHLEASRRGQRPASASEINLATTCRAWCSDATSPSQASVGAT